MIARSSADGLTVNARGVPSYGWLSSLISLALAHSISFRPFAGSPEMPFSCRNQRW